MKRFMKRVCAMAIALCLLLGGASAELGWLDEQLSAFLDTNKDTAFSLGIQLGGLQPFGDDIIAMLNETLAHIRVDSRIRSDGTQMAFTVDGESLLNIEESQRDGRMALTTSLLPNRLLLSDASPMDVLSGNEETEQPLFDLHTAIDEAECLWEELAQAIVPFATEKAANYKIAGIGYARWVRLAKLSAEDSAALLPQIIPVLACGMDSAHREQLQGLTCADGFTVALYSDEENGTPLALYMKGSVYLGDEQKWSLAYQWAFTREAEKEKDTYRYELEQQKSPRHKRMIEAERTTAENAQGIELSRDCQQAIKDDSRNLTLINKDKLTGVQEGNHLTLSGQLETTLKDHSGKDTVTTVTLIKPELALTSVQGSGVLSGTATLKESQGKTVLRELTFTFDEEPAQALTAAEADGSLFVVSETDPLDPSIAGSSLAQNTDVIWPAAPGESFLVGNPPIGLTAYPVPETMRTVDLDLASADSIAALRDEMAQNAAGALLIALGRLPGEPLRLLTDNMTEEDYEAFLSLLGDL